MSDKEKKRESNRLYYEKKKAKKLTFADDPINVITVPDPVIEPVIEPVPDPVPVIDPVA